MRAPAPSCASRLLKVPRKLAIELVGDMTALRVALNALNTDQGDAPSCARAQGIFAQQSASGTRFVIRDGRGRALCGADFPPDLVPSATEADPIAARVTPGRGLGLAIAGGSGATAAVFFPAAFLAETSKPSDFAPPYEATLLVDGNALTLMRLPARGALERRETRRTELGIGGLTLQMSVRSAPITSPLIIAMLLPILMWAAAAGIGWFVVDRLLIRPLRQLRTSVAAYVPGRGDRSSRRPIASCPGDPRAWRYLPHDQPDGGGARSRPGGRAIAADAADARSPSSGQEQPPG